MSKQRNHTYSSVQPRSRILMDEEMMREVLADVGAMRTPIEIEGWGSWILGQTWKQRTRLHAYTELDWMVAIGSPMIGMIAAVGGQRARKALTSIALLDRGPFGRYAAAVALTMPAWKTAPGWVGEIGGAKLTAARTADILEDEKIFLFDMARPGGQRHTVIAGIDDDGYAVDLCLAEGMDPDDWDEEIVEVDLAEAARSVRSAIERTDENHRVPVSPRYADARALVLSRVIDACE
jgi:hypothetical protein